MRLLVRLCAPLAVLTVSACVAPFAAAHGPRGGHGGLVVAVPSAETLVVQTPEGHRERVRLIGLRTQQGGACLANQALQQARHLALGKPVELLRDRSQGLRTPDGAILAYGRLPHGKDLGHRLVRGGFALVSYRKPFALLRSYRIAQIRATGDSEGLWSSRCADLSVALESELSAVTIGNALTYRLYVRNDRRSAARNVKVTLAFSAPVRISTPDPACSSTSVRVVCRLNVLEGGMFPSGAANPVSPASRQIPRAPGSRSFYFVVAPISPVTLTARAHLTSAKADAAPKNNAARVTTTVKPGPAAADLALVMGSEPDHPEVGGLLTYTITVTNLGPSEATGIALTDRPVGADPRGITCRQVCLPLPNFSGPGVLAPGQRASVKLQVAPSSTNSIVNTASVSSTTPDPNAANDSATSTTTAVPRLGSASLAVGITASSPRVRLGQHILYNVTVRNDGPDAATDVVLHDVLSQPGEAQFLGAPPEAGCDAKIVCQLGTLAAGAQETIPLSFVAQHVRGGVLSNYVNVRTATLDPNPLFAFGLRYAEAEIGIAPAGPPSFLIGVRQVGRLQLTPRTSPADVNDAFGVSRDRNGFGEFCNRHWPFGLKISFVAFTGADPCGFNRSVSISRAVVTGAKWRTARGLQIGDPVARIRALYPQAGQHGRSFWLSVRRTPYGGVASGLAAIVRNGRVRALAVSRSY